MSALYEQLKQEAQSLPWWQRHSFFVMIGLAIVIGAISIIVAMHLYRLSGAAQLDLSLPGYQSVRDKVQDKKDLASYPSSGAIDENALNQFGTLLSSQIESLEKVDGFGSDALNNQTLGLPSVDEPAPVN